MAGTMRKRGKNSYYLEYMCEGERYGQSVKANSPTEAKKKLAIFVAEVEKGKYKKNYGITFTELAQMFLDKYAKNNLSDTTIINYKYQLNKNILPNIGHYKINSLKKLHIQDLANKECDEYKRYEANFCNFRERN